MLERRVLGLDLGSYSIKAAELHVGLRSVRFARLEELRLPAPGEPEARQAAIESFLDERALPREVVVTALPADRITQRHLRFPFGTGRRVAQAIAFEIEDELPLPLEDMVIAHEQIPTHPEQTDVLAVLAPREIVRRHLEELRAVAIEPRFVEVEGVVLANVSRLLGLEDTAQLLLDVGHRKSTLCVLVNGRPLALRTVPVAGDHFTAALARELGMSYDEAERHKHERGLFEPLSTKPASAGLERLLDRLVRETQRSVQAVAGDSRNPIAPTAITLCGGGARAAGLAEFLEEQTGLPCRALRVPANTPGCELLAGGDAPLFAQAAALALRGGGRRTRVTRVDLRQDEFRYVADLSGLRGQLLASLGLFVLALALWNAALGSQLWSAQRHERALHAELARVYGEVAPDAIAPPEPVIALEANLRDARELASHLGLSGGGVSVLEVLRHLSERIPESLEISLTDLRLERHTVRARGYTRDFVSVDRVRAELEKVDVFSQVRLSDVVNEPRRGGKSFSLTIQFTGDSE